MDSYELRKHIGNIAELLSEILAEVKGLREDGKETVDCGVFSYHGKTLSSEEIEAAFATMFPPRLGD